ncbi:MAG: hypothetical protein HC929_15700 [Leptolyngbyaceae cyanobacterium SM2_5_2]|nr:hypothetical protein [Leptolyngbyaceae cyanobacterium SM2_5_2]
MQPTEASFLESHQDLFEAKNVAPSTFLHNHKQVLIIDPDLTLAWAKYRAQFALPSQYFRRSGHYPHSGQSRSGQTQRLYWSRLFLERSLQLLRPGGRCGVMLPPFWGRRQQWPTAALARGSGQHRQRGGYFQPSAAVARPIAAHRHESAVAQTPGTHPGQSLQRLSAGRQCPYRRHPRRLLQRLIHLAE